MLKPPTLSHELGVVVADEAEEEQLVAHDRTAERGVGLERLEELLGVVAVPRVGLGLLQALGAVVEADPTVQAVGARLGHHVDHATGRAAVLGLVTARLHLHLLHELERHEGRAEHVAEVGDVQAVDLVGVLSRRRAADRRQALARGVVRVEAAVALGRRRGEQRDLGRLAADRQTPAELLLVDRHAGHGGGHVHQRRLAGHLDDVGDRAEPHHEVVLDGPAERRRRSPACRSGSRRASPAARTWRAAARRTCTHRTRW